MKSLNEIIVFYMIVVPVALLVPTLIWAHLKARKTTGETASSKGSL